MGRDEPMSGEKVVSEGMAHGVLCIRLNRPQVRNAIDMDTLRQLRSAVTEAEDQDDVRAVVLTGTGHKAFSAGGDIEGMRTMTAYEGSVFRQEAHRLLETLERSSRIYIAAMNGDAFGGGLEVALACDLRLCVPTARFGLPELSVGLIPGWGGMQRLSRLVGLTLAKEVVLGGSRLSASDALSRGIVGRVVDEDVLLDEANSMGERIASLSPVAVRQAKLALTEGREMALRHALVLDTQAAAVNFASEDRVEGLTSFVEKRPAQFRGQ